MFALENKLAELKAENKPIGNVLKQIIQALCAEEVGFVWLSSSRTKLSLLLEISFFWCVCVFSPEVCHFVV